MGNKGLAIICEKIDPMSIIIATLTKIREAEDAQMMEQVTKCLIDKKATLFFIYPNPNDIDWNHPWNETMEEYKRLAKLTGGKDFAHNNGIEAMKKEIAAK